MAEHLPSTSDDDESQVGEVAASPDTLVFGRQGAGGSLEPFHPSVPQILRLWQIFLADFYPLVMIFHAPSIQHIISESITDLAEVTSETEALLFSIYLCAVTSMTNHDCLALLGYRKEVILARYSRATQQALADAQFLRSNDLIVLQALTLYLVSMTYNRSTLLGAANIEAASESTIHSFSVSLVAQWTCQPPCANNGPASGARPEAFVTLRC